MIHFVGQYLNNTLIVLFQLTKSFKVLYYYYNKDVFIIFKLFSTKHL